MRHLLKGVLAKSRAKMTGKHHEDEAEDREMIDRIMAEHEGQEQLAPMAAGGYSPKSEKFIDKSMHMFGKGEMHSGSKQGPVVSNPKQAVAIALSEARQKGLKVPKAAHGGEMPYHPNTDYHDKPEKYWMGGYSEGGVTANEGHDDLAADAHSNDFDELVLGDELEPSSLEKVDDEDTDEAHENARRDETIDRIMKSMRKRASGPERVR